MSARDRRNADNDNDADNDAGKESRKGAGPDGKATENPEPQPNGDNADETRQMEGRRIRERRDDDGQHPR